ncbi:hypothetical protein SLA2020_476050 [Shorea laevis]
MNLPSRYILQHVVTLLLWAAFTFLDACLIFFQVLCGLMNIAFRILLAFVKEIFFPQINVTDATIYTVTSCLSKDVQEEDAQCAVVAYPPLSLVLPCSFKGDISSKENLLSPEIRSDSNVVPSPHENSPPALDRMETHSSPQISLAEPCTSIVPLDSISTQRKPCYGWISSDEEGDVC